MLKRTYYIDNLDPFWNTHKYDDQKIMQTLYRMGADHIKSVHKMDDVLLGKVIVFKARRKSLRYYENEFNIVFGSPFSFSVKLKNW